MRLQLLVPRRDEPEGVLMRLLRSAAMQQGISSSELGAVVRDDGGAPLDASCFADLPFPVDYSHRDESLGVSATRNECLDAATADYVMFCDADDMFFNLCGLSLVFDEIERTGGFDTLVSSFVEESRHPETKRPLYISHPVDSTFVHGKVHRRAYLLDNGIRFDPRLKVHEDSYFNVLAQACASDVRFCPTAFYLWSWRDASVCRRDRKYILKTFVDMLKSSDALVSELARRGLDGKASEVFVSMTWDAYYTLNKTDWTDPVNVSYREQTEKRFAEFFDAHKARWESMPTEQRMAISSAVRQRMVLEGMPEETQTIGQWLSSVG